MVTVDEWIVNFEDLIGVGKDMSNNQSSRFSNFRFHIEIDTKNGNDGRSEAWPLAICHEDGCGMNM